MHAPTCASPIAATGALAPWSQPVALSAVGDASRLPSAMIAIDQAARVTLLPTPRVHYALLPEKPGNSVCFGGLVSLRVAKPGTSRIVLGSGAWLDLVSRGKPVASVAHGHGPERSGIHKMVDFPLQAGHHILQLSANGEPQTTVLVVRLP